MDFDVIVEYMPMYVKAFFLTVKIGWIGIVLSLLIGIVAAFILHFKIPVLAQAVKVYVEIFRNTPLLVQLFFIYFGLPKVGLSISAEVCGAVGLGLLGGSYMAESFRSGAANGISTGIGDEPFADVSVGDSSTGIFYQCTGDCCKYHLLIKRNQCVFSNQPDGSDVYCKGSDRTIL